MKNLITITYKNGHVKYARTFEEALIYLGIIKNNRESRTVYNRLYYHYSKERVLNLDSCTLKQVAFVEVEK